MYIYRWNTAYEHTALCTVRSRSDGENRFPYSTSDHYIARSVCDLYSGAVPSTINCMYGAQYTVGYCPWMDVDRNTEYIQSNVWKIHPYHRRIVTSPGESEISPPGIHHGLIESGLIGSIDQRTCLVWRSINRVSWLQRQPSTHPPT